MDEENRIRHQTEFFDFVYTTKAGLYLRLATLVLCLVAVGISFAAEAPFLRYIAGLLIFCGLVHMGFYRKNIVQ